MDMGVGRRLAFDHCTDVHTQRNAFAPLIVIGQALLTCAKAVVVLHESQRLSGMEEVILMYIIQLDAVIWLFVGRPCTAISSRTVFCGHISNNCFSCIDGSHID